MFLFTLWLACFIAANISVLSWYFKDKDQELIIDKSLQAELTLSSDKTIWTIFIRGDDILK